MLSFDPTRSGGALVSLLAEERLPSLGPGTPNEPVRAALAALTPARLFGDQPIRDHDMASACLAGLWLYHDFLDESHALSQEIHTPTGSYWHALLHRREPDYDNARYWFRRVGVHPIFEPLHTTVKAITETVDLPAPAAFLRTRTEWDPFAFVNLCQATATGRMPLELLCRQIQQSEWELLFDWCARQSVGTSE